MVFSSIRRRLSTTRTSGRSSTTSKDSRPEPPAAERLILVYGNCQAHWLAGVLEAQGLGLVCIVGRPYGFYPRQRGLEPQFVDESEVPDLAGRARAAGRQVAILEQTSPINAGLPRATIRLADQVVRFPHLEVRAYWHPWLTKVGDGFDPDRIRRQFAFDLAAMRRSEAKARLEGQFSDLIEQTHRQTLHFNTLNHPGAELMIGLHNRVCGRLRTKGALDKTALAQARRDIRAGNGIRFIMEHPLHDAVIDALELEWARTGWYGHWQQAYFAAGAGHHRKALKLLEAALADSACDPHVNYTLGVLLEGLGDRAGAVEAFGRAHRAYPENPEYARRRLAGYGLPEAGEHPLQARLAERFPGGEV